MCVLAFSFIGCGKTPLYECKKCKEEVFEVKKEDASKYRMCDECYRKWKFNTSEGGH